jgi:nitrate/TMAO reductase-like tetraheme cytochrome c subunit
VKVATSVLIKRAQDKLCMDCHKDVGRDVKEKKGLHGRQLTVKACKECHTDHKGRAAKIRSPR